MLTKEKAKEQIDQMPDQFTIHELIDRLIFIEKVEEGLTDSDHGKTISHEELKKEIEEWFK